MTDLEKSIIGSTLINTIFSEYHQGELTKIGGIIRKRNAKYMRQRSKSNRKLFLQAIKKTDKAWKNTINHFAKEKLRIEAKITITSIYNYMPQALEKFANIKDKDIELFMMRTIDDIEAEKNSDIVVDYLMTEIGIDKKVSLFQGRKLTIKNNLILEGKKIANGF